jgi:hypothetical protein
VDEDKLESDEPKEVYLALWGFKKDVLFIFRILGHDFGLA